MRSIAELPNNWVISFPAGRCPPRERLASVRRDTPRPSTARATSFTAVCVECADLDTAEGYSGATFAGRLELDRDHGAFLCRRGHSVRVQRGSAALAADTAA